MSIPVLTQVYDEVRRLSIAGSVVAAGDFRLKKLVPPLEQAGQKAPVFRKVAQAVTRLVESSEKASAEALLELSTLVNAILYTQGETGLAGKLDPIQATRLGQQQTQTSARVLKPLLEALSTTGSGRFEIIKEAQERGAFRDLRLVGPALAALDDPYPEIADFVAEKVLPLYGKAILPGLRDKFDLKGRGGHVRRLALMHQLDAEGSRDFVKRALDEGSKEVKIAAIECLAGSLDDLSFLLEQARSKSKDVRKAALKALSQCDAGDAIQAVCAALQGSEPELVIEPIRTSRNPQILKFVLDEAHAQWNTLVAGKEKDKAKLSRLVGRMLLILECLRDRDDKATEAFLLDAFGARDKLAAIKGEPSGKDIVQRLVSIMANGPKKAQHVLVDAHASLGEVEFADAFIAACRSHSPAEVFELFSPYLTAKIGTKKKGSDLALIKRKTMVVLIPARLYDGDRETALAANLDPRWLDLAVRQQCLELVQALAVPGHAAANRFLAKSFADEIKQNKAAHRMGPILQAMIRVGHPAAADAVMAAISKVAKAAPRYELFWLAQLIPGLPKESLPKLEAWLPTLPDKAVDQVLDFVTQLKNV